MRDIEQFKTHLEFTTLDIDSDWETPLGYPAGIEQKIVSGRLDETKKCGMRSRLLRFKPGSASTEMFVHDYWEEVMLMSGDLKVGIGYEESFEPYTFACRPPGVHHGPFKSDGGCLLFEIHYYDDADQEQ